MNSIVKKAYDAETFRKIGHELVDLLAAYLEKNQNGGQEKVMNWKEPAEQLEFWKDYLEKGDVEVKVPEKFLKNKFKKVVATKDAMNLVAYLLSLKQIKLPDGTTPPEFLYKQKEKAAATGGGTALPDGGEIYNGNCVACHQANGEGLPGAFPPLKGSPIVLGDDLKLYVTIIMKGYDPRPQWATMPNVGTAANFTPEMVTALINHERSSWGNTAAPVKLEDVKKIMDEIK